MRTFQAQPPTLWSVRAGDGKEDDDEEYNLAQSRTSVHWNFVPDVRNMHKEQLVDFMATVPMADGTIGAKPRAAPQLFEFMHSIALYNYVVMPRLSYEGEVLAVGLVVGKCECNGQRGSSDKEPKFTRDVVWFNNSLQLSNLTGETRKWFTADDQTVKRVAKEFVRRDILSCAFASA